MTTAKVKEERKRRGERSVPYTVLIGNPRSDSVVVVCPELVGGLSIPRGPYEITGGTGKEAIEGKAKVRSDKGEDLTEEFTKGARKTLRIARQNSVKLAILKGRSPSCGVNRIYDGSFSGTLIKGDGVTAALLRKEGIKLISDEKIQN